jgi:hypothetical protein
MLASNNLKQVNRTVLEVFGLGLTDRVNVWQKVMNESVPTRKDEKTTIIKLDNNFTETVDGGAFTDNDIVEIGDYTITQKLYKDKIAISDFSEEFDNYGAIKQAAGEKGFDYSYGMDELAVDFFNNPTSTTAPFGFIVDGSSTKTPLLSATQPIGDTGSTQSNLLTGGLSKENANQLFISMSLQFKHNGNRAGYQLRRLLVPVNEYMKAWQIFRSPQEPEGADRNLNFMNTLNVEVVPWDLLTDTDQTFGLASPMRTRHLKYLIKRRPSLKVTFAETTENVTYKTKMMLMAGICDYQGVVGLGG